MKRVHARIAIDFRLLGTLNFARNFRTHAHAQRQVVLGNATTVLNGLWKFHTGDNAAWANPDFDDAAWGTMDVTPPPGTYDPFYGTSGFVPGWTARGYPGYAG